MAACNDSLGEQRSWDYVRACGEKHAASLEFWLVRLVFDFRRGEINFGRGGEINSQTVISKLLIEWAPLTLANVFGRADGGNLLLIPGNCLLWIICDVTCSVGSGENECLLVKMILFYGEQMSLCVSSTIAYCFWSNDKYSTGRKFDCMFCTQIFW